MGVWELFNTPGRDQSESMAAWTLTAQRGVDFSLTAVSTKAASPEHLALIFRWADAEGRQRVSNQHASQLVALAQMLLCCLRSGNSREDIPNSPRYASGQTKVGSSLGSELRCSQALGALCGTTSGSALCRAGPPPATM